MLTIIDIEEVLFLDQMIDLGLNRGKTSTVELIEDGRDRTYRLIKDDSDEESEEFVDYGIKSMDLFLIAAVVLYISLRIIM